MFPLFIALGFFLSLSVFAQADLSADQLVILADKICKRPKGFFPEIQTVNDARGLVDAIIRNPTECRRVYKDSLTHLDQIIAATKIDACGDSAVQLMDEFFSKYISSLKKDRKLQQEHHYEAPDFAKIFFLHYAYKVASLCKTAVRYSIEFNPPEFIEQTEQGEISGVKKLDNFLVEFSKQFGLDIKSKGLTDVVLPWKVIDSMHVKKKDRAFLNDFFDDCSGDKSADCTRLTIMVKDATKLRSLQRFCREKLRPIYSKQILPVIHMVSLGVYDPFEGEPLTIELFSYKRLRRMFGLTQICETILPIEVFQDESLNEDKVLVLTKAKAKTLREKQPSIPVNELPFRVEIKSKIENPNMKDVNDLFSLKSPYTTQQLLEHALIARVDQEYARKKLTKLAKRRIKSHVKSGPSQLFRIARWDKSEELSEIEIQSNELLDTQYTPSVWNKIGNMFISIVGTMAMFAAIGYFAGTIIALFVG